MQGKTRAHKPNLELILDTVTCRRKLVKINEVVKNVEVRLESCLNVKPIVSQLLRILEVNAQLEEDATPFKLSCETLSEPNPVREEIHVEVGREIRVDTPITVAQDGEGGGPLPMPPIGQAERFINFGSTKFSGGRYVIPPS